MRYLIVLFIVVYFTVIVHSRPAQKDHGNLRVIEEADYEVDSKDGADEQESLANQEESAYEEPEQNRRYLDMNKNFHPLRSLEKDRSDQSNVEISDYRPSKSKDEREINSDDESNVFEGFQFYPKHRKPTKLVQSNDATALQQTQRNNANSFKSNHNSILTEENPIKRTAQDTKMALNEEGDMLFESKDQTDKVDKNDYSNEPLDSNQRFSKQYYSVMHSNNRVNPDSKSQDNERLYFNRQRRNIDTNQQNSDNLNEGDKQENPNASNNEDNETAIKRHIQKLSSDELQELLNSLSEDKKTLLMKIIDDTKISDTDSVHKREITKKAEAVEENSYNENGQLDSSKIQASNIAVTDISVSSSTDVTGSNKQQESKTDGIDLPNTKSSDTTADVKNSYNFQLNNDEAGSLKADDSANSANIDSVGKSGIVSSEPVTIKNENKRETNPKYLSDDSETELSDSFPQDEDLSQLSDENQFDEKSKISKRDVDEQAELESKIKSLEESFPSSDSYDESPGPDLIRVKRNNAEVEMKKRSAALLPDAKVAFFPYRSESDDNDNEEGNEFDDDGFYDRAHVCNKNIDEEDNTAKKRHNTFRLNEKEQQTTSNDLNKEAQIGTDTDNVLSGVEGIDENLMCSSESRNRRTADDNHLSDNMDESNSQLLNSKSLLEDENKALSDSNVNNAPNYQETDAFGPLPRTYDGDLGRYKRIRRVKQSHADETPSDT